MFFDGKMCIRDRLEKVKEDREMQVMQAQQEREAHEAEILAQGGTQLIIYASQGGSSNNVSDNSSENILTCTISIRCDTILDNMDNLKEGKNKYVPSNGVILSSSTVQFVEGETVFDVLKRACSYAGIQLEYSYTPLYESYYIEGINNLYCLLYTSVFAALISRKMTL